MLHEIKARLARIDAAIPQRDVASCWSQPHFFANCPECEAHSVAREKFNDAIRELIMTAQADQRWLINKLQKETEKAASREAALIELATWKTKGKPTGYCWCERKSCFCVDGSSYFERCKKANEALNR